MDCLRRSLDGNSRSSRRRPSHPTLVVGLLLPPHGLLLMTMKSVAPPEIRMIHIFQAVVPYVAMSILVLALVFFVPAVALWLPRLLG